MTGEQRFEDLSPKLLVAYADDEGRFDHVVEAAVDVARRSGGRLILYDASSASAFTEPIAGSVSAEGVEEQYGDPLAPEELERLGRPATAKPVLTAREDGVDAWGWLPSEHGLEAMWDDARRRGADLMVLPAELAEPSVLERLRGDQLDDETLSDAPTPVLVVDGAGNRVVT
jgi:nucleotide-binding universal stress UspA family protein